jgi:hypothetical protein
VALTRARQLDREALARQMRAGTGEEAVSDTQVEKAEADVRAAERRVAARELAAEDARQAHRGEIDAARTQLDRSAERAEGKALARAAKGLDQVADACDELVQAQGLRLWLKPGGGFDNARPISRAAFPTARGSGFHMANGQARDVSQLVQWLREAFEPEPASREAPAEPAHAAQ